MRGIGAPPSPYILRSHLEMQDGLSLQVLLPIGETMTVAKFDHPRRFTATVSERSRSDLPDHLKAVQPA